MTMIIKHRFAGGVAEKMEKIQWRNRDDKTIRARAEKFDNPEQFVSAFNNGDGR